MGKVKTVVLGDIEAEEKAREKASLKREQKKLREGETVVVEEKKIVKKDSGQARMTQGPGKNYQSALSKVDKSKTYSIIDAVKLLQEIKFAKFDETVELIVNVTEKGLRGSATLPHGTGKTLKVVVADEALIENIAKTGKIDFDILVAQPQMMPKLAKIAKIIGPKGLMPNPKTGTVGTDTDKLVKDLSGGTIQFKTQTDLPIIHLRVGKISFEAKKLVENIEIVLKKVGKDKTVSVFLKSSMSPSVKIS